MSAIQLKIEDLVLDNDNPRITHAESHQQARLNVLATGARRKAE